MQKQQELMRDLVDDANTPALSLSWSQNDTRHAMAYGKTDISTPNRVDTKWTDTNFDAYQKGATQIPANAQVVVFGRFNRKIGTDKFKLKIAQTS